MTTTTAEALREIVCSNCGEPLGEYSRTERTKVGRCCFNLPDPWDMPGEASDDEADYDHWDFIDEGRSLDDFREYTQSRWGRDPSNAEAAAFVTS